jgi:ubiquinone/menaquinone biosynthesis C-methylase UbiE
MSESHNETESQENRIHAFRHVLSLTTSPENRRSGGYQAEEDSESAGEMTDELDGERGRKHVPDWRLPRGVSRGLWDYLQDRALAEGYDAALRGNSLAAVDMEVAEGLFRKPGRVIDLGCGTGRLALHLAGQGHQVVAVDLSAEMLRVLGEKARLQGKHVDCLQANIVELDGLADQSFDYAACLFSTLGMVMGAEHRQRVLEHAFRLLKNGGVFLLHVHNRWHNLRDQAGRRWLVADTWQSLSGKKGAGDRPMPVHQGVAGLALHHYTRREIVANLKQVGFDVIQVNPISLAADGRLRIAWLLPSLRCYGYLAAAARPDFKNRRFPASAGRE